FALLLDSCISAGIPLLPPYFSAYHRYMTSKGTGESRPGSLEFWKDYLAGADPVVRLPGSMYLKSEASSRGGKLPAHLDLITAGKVLNCAKACGTSAFTVILAAFGSFLFRLSGQRSFTIAVPVSLRSDPESLGIVGPMINTIPVRCD